MTEALARALMAVALRCLGKHRAEWAAAMRVEFDVATEAGEPLSFARDLTAVPGRGGGS